MVGRCGDESLITAVSSGLLIETLDLVGTVVFVLSGAILGVQRGLDVFGVLVLAYVTAVSGGIMRDVLIGVVPPNAIASWHALALSVASGLLAIHFQALIGRLRFPVQLFDAAGLGAFAVAGTQQALAHGLTPLMAAVLGMVSGIGGGMVRDVLTARTPIVLKAEIYAVAALAGAVVVAIGPLAGLPALTTAPIGIGLCLFLRKWRSTAAGSSRRHVQQTAAPPRDQRLRLAYDFDQISTAADCRECSPSFLVSERARQITGQDPRRWRWII